ncbi:SAM-dependent methyltransferase [Luteolibacter sp. LG18]|nr:SAM-dependent methyltransferase [Luteolibacter sp. LG18]
MPFDRFMAAALYDPTRGYYARGTRQVGRKGDFFTSVSVGPAFGQLLARRFADWWTGAGEPARWRILEMGAHDGTLARDILETLAASSPTAFAGLTYAILEQLPSLAAAQTERLSDYGDRFQSVASPAELAPLPGIIFGNELLDALPCHVLEWREAFWWEGRIDASNGHFQWNFNIRWDGPSPQPSVPLPSGYRTETRTGYRDLLASLAPTLERGLMLWIDYGFARPEYLLPERTAGTLRTFTRHRAGDDPLDSPGERDITAHVDFTAVAEAALSLGIVPTDFRDQGSWLTRQAGTWLRHLEQHPDPAAIRQFQTLVHPAHLGARFHVLELSVNEVADEAARARAAARLALGE